MGCSWLIKLIITYANRDLQAIITAFIEWGSEMKREINLITMHLALMQFIIPKGGITKTNVLMRTSNLSKLKNKILSRVVLLRRKGNLQFPSRPTEFPSQ